MPRIYTQAHCRCHMTGQDRKTFTCEEAAGGCCQPVFRGSPIWLPAAERCSYSSFTNSHAELEVLAAQAAVCSQLEHKFNQETG